jgi:putative FmdB family regulatory protein
MPIYEYRCASCRKRFSLLLGMTAEPDEEKCPHCGSTEINKLVSRFFRYRSEDDRIDALADTLESMGEPDDPKEMRRLVREMGKAMDEDMSEEMEELFEADMAGEDEEGRPSDDDL